MASALTVKQLGEGALASGHDAAATDSAALARLVTHARETALNLGLGVSLALAGWYAFAAVSLSSSARTRVDVSRADCSCGCFDGVMKGGHILGGYKSIYFNVDEVTPVLLVWSVLWGISALTLARTMAHTLSQARTLTHSQWAMLFVIASTLYPMFYGYWAVFNYWNDRFYPLLRAQLVFLVSEVCVCVAACVCMTERGANHPALLWAMNGIAAFHLLQNVADANIPAFGMRLMGALDALVLAVTVPHTCALVFGSGKTRYTPTRLLIPHLMRGILIGEPHVSLPSAPYTTRLAGRDLLCACACVCAALALKPTLVGG